MNIEVIEKALCEFLREVGEHKKSHNKSGKNMNKSLTLRDLVMLLKAARGVREPLNSIACDLGVTSAGMTSAVQTLFDFEFVERESDLNDRRVKYLVASPETQKMLERLVRDISSN